MKIGRIRAVVSIPELRNRARAAGTKKLKETQVRNAFIPTFAAAILLTGCATDSYGKRDVSTRTMVGVLAGGAIGAVAAPAIGANAIVGVAAGMVAGGAAGLLIKGPKIHGRQYYRDTQGYCYYITASGKPKYNSSVKC